MSPATPRGFASVQGCRSAEPGSRPRSQPDRSRATVAPGLLHAGGCRIGSKQGAVDRPDRRAENHVGHHRALSQSTQHPHLVGAQDAASSKHKCHVASWSAEFHATSSYPQVVPAPRGAEIRRVTLPCPDPISPVHPDPAVRRATRADAGALGALLHRFNTEFASSTPGASALAGRLDELLGHETGALHGHGTVALISGPGPDGFAIVRLRPSLYSSQLEAYLAELYVVPEQRGRGLGRALLRSCMRARAGPRSRSDRARDQRGRPRGSRAV